MFSLRGLAIATILASFSLCSWANTSPDLFSTGAVSYQLRWFSGAADHWLSGQYLYRLDKHWAMGGELGGALSLDALQSQASLIWLPRGNMRRKNTEDWVGLRLGGVVRKAPWDPACVSCESWRSGPYTGLAYGRDMRPGPQWDMGMRMGIELAYVVGKALARRGVAGSMVGFETIRPGNFIIGIQVGFWWF